jgi:chemotaxis-related protein WspB
MLMLLFYLGEATYGINCEKIREICPLVKLEKIPHAPNYFAGLFKYRGAIVPVIDLRRLVQDEPCEMRLSTRIILVDFQEKDGTGYIVGFMAERVTETVRQAREAFVSSGINMNGAPFLGGIMMENDHMVQLIDLDRLPESFKLLPMPDAMNNKEKASE